MTTKDYEGFSPTIYKDTVGKRTVGYGFNIDDPAMAKMIPPEVVAGRRPISKDEADNIFQSRNDQAISDSIKYLGDTYDKIDPEAKNVINDMAYNLGLKKLSKFQGLKKALADNDYQRAADEIKYKNADAKDAASPYFIQTGRRAKDHVQRMLNARNRQVAGEIQNDLING
jgi:lysozyme